MKKMIKEKKSSGKYSSLAENTFLFFVSNFGSKIISFLLVPFYTYMLTPDEYGTIDLITSTATLLVPILTLNIQEAVLRFGLDKNYSPKDVITTACRVNGVGAVVLGFLMFVFYSTGILKFNREYLFFLFCLYFSGALNNSFNLYMKAVGKIKVFTVSGVLHVLMVCSLNLLFLLVFKMGINGYLLACVLSSVTAVLYQFFAGKIYKDIEIKRQKNISRDMILYSLPLVANTVAWWVNTVADRYFVTAMCGIAINGIYSVAYKIPTILATVQHTFYNAWSISAIKDFDSEDKDGFIGNVFSLYSFVSVTACSLMMIFNIPLSSLLYSKEFYEAWKYVPILLVGTVFNGLALFEGCLFNAVKKTKDVSKTTVLGAVINVICNFVFIKFFGAQGAALATMLGYAVSFATCSIMMRKFIIMKINRPVIILSYILMTLQSVVALKENLWYVQIIIFVLLIVIQHKYLVSFFKKFKEVIVRKKRF